MKGIRIKGFPVWNKKKTEQLCTGYKHKFAGRGGLAVIAILFVVL